MISTPRAASCRAKSASPRFSDTEISARRGTIRSVMAARLVLQPEKVQRAPDHLRLVVQFDRPRPPRTAHPGAEIGVGGEATQGFGKRTRLARRHEQAGGSVGDLLADAAHAGGDDGKPG